VETIWAALAASDPAVWIRFSRWGYAAVSTGHVLGIAMLVGSIMVLDLRLLGVIRRLDPDVLARLVIPIAISGLVLAIATGSLLFIGSAGDYAGFRTFQIKLTLIAIGCIAALTTHIRYGLWLDRANPGQRIRIGLISLSCWLGALICGRLIAFIHG